MSFNGSGTFLINSTGQPVVANTVISATVFNALTADLASGLTNCITKDGQSTPTANIPMGSNKITGLANGTLINDAATLGQVQSTAAKLIGSISGVDTVLGIMSPTLTAYAAGQLFYFVAAGANTGAVTLNIDGLGAKAVTRDGAIALAAGDINSGEIVVVIYDGTRFQMINAANSFGNTTINGTLTVTGNTGLQANVSITSTLSVGGTFAVTGAATLGSTLAVTGKSDLPTVSTASVNAAVAAITTATVTNLTATSASVASVNAGVALLTTATVTDLTASSASIASANIGNLSLVGVSVASANFGVAVVGSLTATSASVASVNAGVALLTTATVTDLTASSASIASANIGNLQFTAASIASINAGVAVVTNLTATSASIASANVGTAVITTGTVTNLTSTSASIASANAAVALVTTGTVTNLTSTAASIASANLGTAVITTGTVTNLTATSASIASANAGAAVVTNLTATGASIASANVGTGVVTALTVTGASIASANVGTGVITTLTATGASVASINAGVALVTTGTVTNLTSTAASIASANIGVAAIGTLSFTGASIASLNAGTATITTGNLTFSSTAQRITGDFSNATIANRLAFQTSTTNGATDAAFVPNGTGNISRTFFYNQSDLSSGNLSANWIGSTATEFSLRAAIHGTGTYLPMTFYTGGSERMRLDTSGNVGIGTASPAQKLDVVGTSRYAFNVGNAYTLQSSTNAAGSAFADDYKNALSHIWQTSGTERMRIDASGNVGIGGTAYAGTKVEVKGTLPVDANFTLGFDVTGTIPSGTTDSYYGYRSAPSTAAASYTLANMQHFRAQANVIGAGSAITNQFGFYAHSDLTGATNNFGFYSNIASGSNRWNFYAAGTAANYFAGNVQIGSNTGQRIIGDFSDATKSNRLSFQTSVANSNTNIQVIPSGTGQRSSLFLFSDQSVNNCSLAVFSVIGSASLVALESAIEGSGTYLPLAFYTGGSERMRITTGGEVYIAGTTDQGAYNLQCNGTGVWGAGAYVNGSDARLKDNIQSLDSGLDVVKAMRPVTFQYKPEYSKDQNVQPGFIAQELQEAMAGKPYLEGVVQEGTNHLNVAYQNIIPILVKAIQELEAKVAALEAK